MEEKRGIERYQIINKLNDRNSVFLVKNVLDGSLWVEKIIEKESIEIYRRLINIRQPNIAYAKELYIRDEGAIVIEEYAEGISIFDAINSGKLFTVSEVREIVFQLCDALKCLHKNNIVHRDISANNVIIDSKGNVKLIDMGISRIKNPQKSVDTYFMGTAGYAAPEQFGFRQTDEKSDIFSLGVLMNVMLTGKFPSEGIYCGNRRMEKIISKCIEMEPKNRYKNVNEVKRCFMTISTEKNNKLMAMIKELPGTRTMTWWKMMIAFFIYAVIFIFFDIVEITCLNQGRYFDMLAFGIWIVIGIFVPCLLSGNYMYYADRMKLTAKLPNALKTIICYCLGIGLATIIFYFLYMLLV